MILTIDLDPVFKSNYDIGNFQDKMKIKSKSTVYSIGGSGLNTSQIIKKQNLNIFSTGFLGGLKGEYIFEKLKELNIYNDFIFINDETKGRILLEQNKKIVSIIEEESPKITRQELKEFYQLYDKISQRSKFICGLGEVPIGVPYEIYFDLIQIAKNNGKRFILDAKNEELLYGIEAQPFIVIMDQEDLEEFARIKLNSESEIVTVANSIIEKGIEIVIIDLKEEGSIVFNKETCYRLKLIDKSIGIINVDKGYTVAGYAIGIEKQYDIETTMKLGQAMRIAYGLERNFNIVNMRDVKRIMSKIDVSEIVY